MSEKDLYQTTMRGFQNKLLGQRQFNEIKHKEVWEHHRELVVTIMSPNLDKKYRKKSAKELYPLPWDVKVSKGKTVDKEKLAKAFEYLDQRIKE